MNDSIGQPVLRREDDRLLRGNSRYVADLQLSHQLHARFVRATVARGQVTRIDTSEAEALPGVVAVLTADDPELGTIRIVASSTQKTHIETPQPLLTRQIRYLGEAVGVVVAINRYIAADAAALIEIDYETEPVHVDGLAAALDPQPPVHPHAPDNVLIHRTFDTGGIDESLANAPVVVDAEFRTNRQTAAPMEGRALLADYDAGRRHLTVHASHQSPHLLRWGLAP
ncbi:MAG: xanthine dehydrogenase family protein molybdopterin-binding subunit, partial [Actinomycetia bacterium]|nr:xanthine dehydrogenase family protein molybdopterin-binding subunit [Actinomycetes bacterium]